MESRPEIAIGLDSRIFREYYYLNGMIALRTIFCKSIVTKE